MWAFDANDADNNNRPAPLILAIGCSVTDGDDSYDLEIEIDAQSNKDGAYVSFGDVSAITVGADAASATTHYVDSDYHELLAPLENKNDLILQVQLSQANPDNNGTCSQELYFHGCHVYYTLSQK